MDITMPANLTPQYLKAEQAFKDARTVEEKIAALQEMLSVMPKHKGTDHLQADLKRKLSKLKDESVSEAKKKKGVFDPFRLDRHGAGQVVVLGGPNAGKSALVGKLTNAPTQVTPYPFGTTAPVPGMMRYEDVSVQMIDLPPILGSEVPGGMMSLVKGADGALLLADLAAPEVLDHLEAILNAFDEGRARLHQPERPPPPEPLVRDIPCLLLANKCDLPGALDVVPIISEMLQGRFDPVPISAGRGDALGEIPGRVFKLLDLVRVYSKLPGKPPDMTSPTPVKRGATVVDFARIIHRDFPDHLKEARVWGSARFDGQAVPRDHVLVDKDVVELHVDL
jgi:ribosome-interacting GTPase 1